MDRIIIRILLILLVLTFAAIACVKGGDETVSKGSPIIHSNQASNSGLAATATFGAEQFHLQLTAVAKPGQ